MNAINEAFYVKSMQTESILNETWILVPSSFRDYRPVTVGDYVTRVFVFRPLDGGVSLFFIFEVIYYRNEKWNGWKIINNRLTIKIIVL